MTITKRALIWTAFLGLVLLIWLIFLTIEAEAEARGVGAWGSGSRDASYRKNEGCHGQFAGSHECQGPGLVRAPAHLLLDAILACIAEGETGGHFDPYRALNPHSSASGRGQILDGVWVAEGFAERYGVPRAYLAAPYEQDEAMVILLVRYGLKPWKESGADRRCRFGTA